MDYRFKEELARNEGYFTEEFLCKLVGVKKHEFVKRANKLYELGHIIIYDSKKLRNRKFGIADAFLVLSKFKGEKQIQVRNYFKKEFLYGQR